MQEPPLALYGLLIAIILGFVGVGFRVVAYMHSRDEARISNVCFLLAAIVAGGVSFMWGVTTPQNVFARLFVCFFSFGLIGWLAVEAVRYVGRQSKIKVRPNQESESVSPIPLSSPTDTPSPPPSSTPPPSPSPSSDPKRTSGETQQDSSIKTKSRRRPQTKVSKEEKQKALEDLDYKSPQ